MTGSDDGGNVISRCRLVLVLVAAGCAGPEDQATDGGFSAAFGIVEDGCMEGTGALDGGIVEADVRFRLQLDCAPDGEQTLSVRWGRQHVFQLDGLDYHDCTDDPGWQPGNFTPIDAFYGEGAGTLDGAPASIVLNFQDGGDPADDRGAIQIFDASGELVLRASSAPVDGDIEASAECDQGCTSSRRYFLTHHSFADVGLRVPWPLVPGFEAPTENARLCGRSLYDTLQTPPEGDPWLSLAHRWITARLNVARGADGFDVANALDNGWEILADCAVTADEERDASGIESRLAAFNSGRIGPGECGEEVEPPQCVTTYVPTGAPSERFREVYDESQHLARTESPESERVFTHDGVEERDTNGALVATIAYTWEGDRLVFRAERRTDRPGGNSNTSWSYGSGFELLRMDQVALLPSSNTWTYDQQFALVGYTGSFPDGGTLEYHWSSAVGLVSQYSIEDGTIVNDDTWLFDGRLVEHVHRFGFVGQPFTVTTTRFVWEGEGLRVARSTSQTCDERDGTCDPLTITERQYDVTEPARLVGEETRTEDGTLLSVRTLTYDARGRLVRDELDDVSPSDQDRLETWAYDDQGRLVEHRLDDSVERWTFLVYGALVGFERDGYREEWDGRGNLLLRSIDGEVTERWSYEGACQCEGAGDVYVVEAIPTRPCEIDLIEEPVEPLPPYAVGPYQHPQRAPVPRPPELP